MTALPEWVRDALRCPACTSELVDQQDVREGDGRGLVCAGCGRVYPVRDGIPVLLVDEATGGPATG